MRRLDGVFDVKVDLKKGQAVIMVRTRQRFDPDAIPKAVKRAGFTPGPIHLVAVGRVRVEKDHLLLGLEGQRVFLLAGGSRFEALRAATPLGGRRARITGEMKPAVTKGMPGLEVEDWNWVREEQ